MLLTLTARSLTSRLNARGSSALSLGDLPRFVSQQTALRGLVFDTALLKGWGLDELDTLRTQSDQASCPCLVLRESLPIMSCAAPGDAFDKSMKRVELIARAANRLGCNALAVQPQCRSHSADEREFDLHTNFFRRVLERVDRLELNILIEPGHSWLGEPQWLVELVKKVGGFRIGTLPTFAAACATPDPVQTLRQTAPYAGAVLGSFADHDVDLSADGEDDVEGEGQAEAAEIPKDETPKEASPEEESPKAASPKKKKKRTSKKATRAKAQPAPVSRLGDCIEALRAVGFEQILALDYLGDGDAIAAVNAARRKIESLLESA